jgi:protein-tyrosine phosphatase
MLDLSWITETLAIGGSFRPTQTVELEREHRVSAVVDLRGEESDDPRLLAKHGLEFLHLPTIDFAPLTTAAIQRGVAFVIARVSVGRRVLVHCAKGIGRAPVLGISVLVAQGRDPMDALALAKDRRDCVSPNPEQYEAWAAWLALWRRESGATWDVPTFAQFRAIAYRHLQ